MLTFRNEFYLIHGMASMPGLDFVAMSKRNSVWATLLCCHQHKTSETKSHLLFILVPSLASKSSVFSCKSSLRTPIRFDKVSDLLLYLFLALRKTRCDSLNKYTGTIKLFGELLHRPSERVGAP